jgi:co-chaperonin GroES (HSP10)
MLQAITNRVLIQILDLEKEHDLGNGKKLILHYGADEARRRATITDGVVLSVGPDCWSDFGYTPETQPVKTGDTVQFAKFAGSAVADPEDPSKRLVMLNDEDVLAIIKSKENTNE